VLARESRLSKSAVIRAIHRLEADGELVVKRVAQPGRSQVNGYTIPGYEGSRNATLFEGERVAFDAEKGRARATRTIENHREPLAPAPRARERDGIFDALCDVTDTDPAELTKPGRGALNAATKELRTLGVDPDEVAARAHAFHRQYPNAVLTAPALVKHWASLGNGHASTVSAPLTTIEEDRAEFERLTRENPL
jgi:hypothetical protein